MTSQTAWKLGRYKESFIWLKMINYSYTFLVYLYCLFHVTCIRISLACLKFETKLRELVRATHWTLKGLSGSCFHGVLKRSKMPICAQWNRKYRRGNAVASFDRIERRCAHARIWSATSRRLELRRNVLVRDELHWNAFVDIVAVTSPWHRHDIAIYMKKI